MKQRKFSHSGPSVGAMGFGAMSFGGFYGEADDAESQRALAMALDTGTTHWDTSDVYGFGRSETMIGQFFRDNPGARAKVHLATKGGIKRQPGTTERVFDNSAEYLRGTLEASLKRLGVDYVDCYYVHRREQARDVEEVAATMATLIKEGKIRGYGLSEIAPWSVKRAHAVHPVMAVQNEYSLWTRLPELGLLQTCRELGIAFVAFSPVARGMFAGTVPAGTEFGKFDFRRGNPRFTEPNFSRNLQLLQPFFAFAKARGVTSAQVALAWLLTRGDHIIPIPGTRYASRVKENADAAALTLNAADVEELDRILPIGFAHGARYSDFQQIGSELYG